MQRNHVSNDLNSCSANIGRVKDIAQTGVHPAQSGNSMGLGQFVSDAPRAGDFLCPRFGSQKMRRIPGSRPETHQNKPQQRALVENPIWQWEDTCFFPGA